MPIDIVRIPLADEPDEQLRHYLAAVRIGFLEPTPSEATVTEWLTLCRLNKARLFAVQSEDASAHPGLSGVPVATYSSWDGTYNAGAGLIPTDFVSEVTVRPTHRRRGLLRALVTHDLTQAALRGQPLAALTATDAKIYGRFGFGIASQVSKVEVNTGHDFVVTAPWSGSVHYVDPVSASDIGRDIHERWHETHRGSLSRPAQYYRPDWDWRTEEKAKAFRCLLHRDDEGRPQGWMLIRVESEGELLRVVDLVALTPDAEFGLWTTIGAIELNQKVVADSLDPNSPLWWALGDNRVLRTVSVEDHIWLRILDPLAALRGRGWERDGRCVLRVDDPMGFADGAYLIEVRDGEARVEPTEAAWDARTSVSDLASLYSGVIPAETLRQSGRLIADAPAAARIGELFATRLKPFSLSTF